MAPRSRSWNRALVVAAALLAGSSLGCDSAIDVDNATPRVTWLDVDPPPAGGGPDVARLTLWIADTEGDLVDLELTWEGEAIDQAPGGHGLEGLTTLEALNDPDGQPHEILWIVPSGAGSGRLTCTPSDEEAGVGAQVQSPELDPSGGLEGPVAWQEQG